MTAAVKLSPKSARALLDAINPMFASSNAARALDEIRRQLEPKPKSSAVRKTEQKQREVRRETRTIRDDVERRAGGRCERCGLPFSHTNPDELDHFFGRGKVPQSVANTWLLCRVCHREKTHNYPSALAWLSFFRDHCQRHGYHAEARRAEARMDAIRMTRGGEI